MDYSTKYVLCLAGIIAVFMIATVTYEPTEPVDDHKLRTYVLDGKEFQLNLTDEDVSRITGNNTNSIIYHYEDGSVHDQIIKVNSTNRVLDNVSDDAYVRNQYPTEDIQYIYMNDKEKHVYEFNSSDGSTYELISYATFKRIAFEEVYNGLV